MAALEYSSIKEVILKRWLPEALAIGVSYQDFWFLTPARLNSFIGAFEIKLRRQMDVINYQSWLNGIYQMSAISSLLNQSNKYPESPYDFSRTISMEERAQIEADLFRAYVAECNKHLQPEE